MDKNQLVSIIMPSYNVENVIGEAIESVLAQSYVYWELLIIDDCSTDGTTTTVSPYLKDMRVNLIKLPKNIGASKARNTGLKKASGRYVAFLDSDDCWKSDKLAKQLKVLNKHQTFLVYSGYSIFKHSIEQLKNVIKVPASITYDELLRNTIIGCSTVLIDRKQTGEFYMPDIQMGEDTSTWLSLLYDNNGKAYGVQETLSYYRLTPSSLSSNKVKNAWYTWRVYYQRKDLSFFRKCVCFCHYAKNAIVKRL